MLYSTEIIRIEFWGEIILALKIKNQIFVFVLKEVTYVLNFYLNLILLACFKDKKYR